MLSFHCFLGFYYCVFTKQMNSNKSYITASCNSYSYSYVITVITNQLCSKMYKSVKLQDFWQL